VTIQTSPAGTGLAELVTRYYEAVDAHDVDELLLLFAPDAVYHRPGYEPLHGRDDLARFYQGERIIESGRHTIENMVVDGPTVAVHGRFEGNSRDGRRLDLRFADFFEGDRLIDARRTFFYAPLA